MNSQQRMNRTSVFITHTYTIMNECMLWYNDNIPHIHKCRYNNFYVTISRECVCVSWLSVTRYMWCA